MSRAIDPPGRSSPDGSRTARASGKRTQRFHCTRKAPQYAALVTVHEHPGIDQATLAGLIAHDRPTIGGVVERLAAEGLVERRTSATDRRTKRLELTRRGEKLVARLRPIIEALQDEILP